MNEVLIGSAMGTVGLGPSHHLQTYLTCQQTTFSNSFMLSFHSQPNFKTSTYFFYN